MIILDYLKQAQNQRTEGITFERRKLVFKRAMQPKMMTPMSDNQANKNDYHCFTYYCSLLDQSHCHHQAKEDS